MMIGCSCWMDHQIRMRRLTNDTCLRGLSDDCSTIGGGVHFSALTGLQAGGARVLIGRMACWQHARPDVIGLRSPLWEYIASSQYFLCSSLYEFRHTLLLKTSAVGFPAAELAKAGATAAGFCFALRKRGRRRPRVHAPTGGLPRRQSPRRHCTAIRHLSATSQPEPFRRRYFSRQILSLRMAAYWE
jgi:hypothetical protein